MQVAAQASGSVMPATMLRPKRSTKPGDLDDRVGGQVGDDAVVLDVEVAAIDAAGLQRLEDVAGMLVRALAPDRSARPACSRNCGKSVSNQLRFSVE